MGTVRVLTIIVVLALVAFGVPNARAEVATPEEMQRVCQNRLSYMVYQKGAWAGETGPKIVDVQEIVASDGSTVLARCYSITPRGYVVVPVLKELPPVKSYSEEYGLDVNQGGGFPLLLREVLEDRINLFIEQYGSLDASQPRSGEVLFGRTHREEWDRFLVDPDQFQADLGRGVFSPLTEIGPLVATVWHQSPPYNDDCPFGDGAITVVGCLATATAQIMNFHQWPDKGVGSFTYWWNGDSTKGGSKPFPGAQNLTGNFDDEYAWDDMHVEYSPSATAPLGFDCVDELGNTNPCTQAELDAVAELCSEVGIASR